VSSILQQEGRAFGVRRASQLSEGRAPDFKQKVELFKMQYPISEEMLKYDE